MSKAPNFKGLTATSDRASQTLKNIKSTETRGERLLRSVLWRKGLRFRKNVKQLLGKPDIVFPRQRVLVFCDGDFWHGRNWSKDRRRIKTGPNSEYWLAKIKANMERDKRHNVELRREGWIIIRLWDSDIHENVEREAQKVLSIITSNSAPKMRC